MPSTRLVNMLIMIQKLKLVLEKSFKKIDHPSCKKPALGPRSPTRGTLRGRRLVWTSNSFIINSKIW
jgi:hypothetical protein